MSIANAEVKQTETEKKMVKDLKVQFRAVHFSGYDKVLEYRVNPKQEGLSGFKRIAWMFIKVFFIFWKRPCPCVGTDGDWASCQTCPIFCNRNDLEYYKKKYVTYGEFRSMLKERSNNAYEQWKRERSEYLKTTKTIY